MKKKYLGMALLALVLTGCTNSTHYGECIGAFDDKDPSLKYKVDASNVIIATIFFETLVVPVIVVANETLCPVGKK